MRVTSSPPQTDVTLVLVVVVFVFIVCQTPTFVDHILWTALDASRRACGAWHYYYTAVGDLMAICNSSVNFIIYVLTSPKFRHTLVSMLLRPAVCTSAAEMLRSGGGKARDSVGAGAGGNTSVIVRVARRSRAVGTAADGGRLSAGLNGLKNDDCDAAETILLYKPMTMHGSMEML